MYVYKPLRITPLNNNLCEIFLHAAGFTAAELRKEIVPPPPPGTEKTARQKATREGARS